MTTPARQGSAARDLMPRGSDWNDHVIGLILIVLGALAAVIAVWLAAIGETPF